VGGQRVEEEVDVVVARGRLHNGLMVAKATRGRPTREPAPEAPAKERSRRRSVLTSLGFIAFGAVLLVVGAQLLVSAATTIARAVGVSDLVIGLTIVAIGTSLPELAASIVAVARGERDLAVGNIVGSNVFNIGLVLGLTALASPEGISVTADATAFHLPILLATALVLLPVTLTKMTVSRLEGALFVGFYTAYIGYLVLESFGYVKTGPLGLMMLGFVVPMTAMWLVLLVINEWDTLRHRGSGLFGSERTARAVRRHARSD
jgi:cation:H+ antiporter